MRAPWKNGPFWGWDIEEYKISDCGVSCSLIVPENKEVLKKKKKKRSQLEKTPSGQRQNNMSNSKINNDNIGL